ncbi:MAG: radical SAM protein, partial [Candidatus Bathyarchaeia archaeon]
MSDYHHNEFVGFGTCAPPNVIPDMLYSWLFFPPIKNRRGVPIAAPYGLRKIEAQLMAEGFDVLTVDPENVWRYIEDARVLGVHVMDPFGVGPASSTFAAVLKKEPFLAQHFRRLLEKREIKRAKKRGLKIIVGGSGVWQFRYREKFASEHGIDCIIDGEAEKVIGKIMRAAFKGEQLPQYYEVGVGETPSLEEIPNIVNPSINGLVEIGRGCCRGCRFCSV